MAATKVTDQSGGKQKRQIKAYAMAELAPFDRENLNEDVERMRALWVNEMVR